MTIFAHKTYQAATLDLSAQILDRWGNDPSIISELHFGAMATPHGGSDRHGVTIFCHPRAGIREHDELLAVYFGDAPVFLDA
jgi:hypothetical protein